MPGRTSFDRTVLERPSVEVAPLLLDAVVHSRGVSVRITEVEAYLGALDPGSHAFRGETPRNRVMFGEPGHLYTYFTYGMHVCANFVCSPEGEATAVLLRGAEVVEGYPLALARRSGAVGPRTSARGPVRDVPARDLGRGPARLVVAAGISLEENGADLFATPFSLRLPRIPLPYVTGPRTGISGAGGSESFPWRFWLPDDPTVSPYKRHPKSH